VGPALPRLSARETEILHYMARGHSNKEIARALGISPETVKWYLKHIYDKLQVSGRVQAIQAGLGVRMALVPEAEPD
jgi:LuxR family maltose regulon positive regulatory protein